MVQKVTSLSVIILSYAIDDEIYQMNRRALESLLKSEDWTDSALDVVLIESNKSNPYKYDDVLIEHEHQARFRIEIPQERFNFHRFLNIGISHSNGEFVAMCNNDIEFQKGWFSAILAVKNVHPEFMCFSPLDRSYPLMSETSLPSNEPYYVGWENKKHFAAWCFVWERKVFDVIGKLDETFDFYSADDDELMTLRKYAISNVVVTGSEVKHLSQVVTKKMGESKWRVTDKEKYPLSEKELKRGLAWLWDDVRFYVAYRRMEAKWGNERMIRRINRLFDKFHFLNKRPLTKLIYNKKVVNCLAKITGI